MIYVDWTQILLAVVNTIQVILLAWLTGEARAARLAVVHKAEVDLRESN